MHIIIVSMYLFIIYAHEFNVSCNCLGGAETSASTGKYSSCCFHCMVYNNEF